jgi:hypothetical protein
MASGESLHQVLRAARRIAHPEGRDNSGAPEAIDQRAQRTAQKSIADRDMRVARRRERAAALGESHPDIDPRLNQVPAVNRQHQRPPLYGHHPFEPLRDHRQQPRRARGYLSEAITVDQVSIHPGVDQRHRVEPPGQFASQFGGMQIVDARGQQPMRVRCGAPAMGRDQHDRRAAVHHFEPVGNHVLAAASWRVSR